MFTTSCKPRQSNISKNDKGYVVTFSRKDLRNITREQNKEPIVDICTIAPFVLSFNSVSEVKEFFKEGDISYQKVDYILSCFAYPEVKDYSMQFFDIDSINQLCVDLDDLECISAYIIRLDCDSYEYVISAERENGKSGYTIHFFWNFSKNLHSVVDENEESYTTVIDGYSAKVQQLTYDDSVYTNVEFDPIVLDNGTINISKSLRKKNHNTENGYETGDIYLSGIIDGISCYCMIGYHIYAPATHDHYSVDWIIENTRLMPYDEAYEQKIFEKKIS